MRGLSNPDVERPADMLLDDAALGRALELARRPDWPQLLPFGMDAPFFQAGLAGYSDAAMRLIARRHGAPYCITEAMLDQFLINGGRGLDAARLRPDDHPIAGQLMGSHPAEIAQGARILVDLGYDVVDVNLACPVKKIKKRSRGGHLLRAPDEAVAILEAVRRAVPESVPVTVKLRRGSDDTAQADADFQRVFRAVLDLGYAGATVHGRTVEQKYLGPSRWSFLRELAASCAGRRRPGSGGFHLFGSGDVWDAVDVFRMMEQTGIDGVSVARGCIGNPWVFEQARALMRGDVVAATTPPTVGQQRRVLLEHFGLAVEVHGEAVASRTMRKFGIRFSQHHPQGEAVRGAFIAVHSLSDWRGVLERFYGEEERPGVRFGRAAGDVEDSCAEPAAGEASIACG